LAGNLHKLGYYDDLHQLIETVYLNNNNTPVTLIAHSLGGPTSLYFLRYVADSQWKSSRLKQYITLSGAFGGTVKTALGIISGDVEGVPTARTSVLREAQRSYPSQVMLLPSNKLWNDSDVIVSQPSRNYTVNDLDRLFADINYGNGSRILREVRNFTIDFTPPNITHYCFYGDGVDTAATLVYGDKFPDSEPVMKYGNGDGSVNEVSLQVCHLWKGQQVQPVNIKAFFGISHFSMTTNPDVLKELAQLVAN
jgi:lysophospholipase-3